MTTAVRRATVACVLVVLTCGLAASAAGAASSGDTKEYKAFISQLNAVQNAAANTLRSTADGSDRGAVQAACAELGLALKKATSTRRPKLVRASVWKNVTGSYSHYQNAADACAKLAPSTDYFETTLQELNAGNMQMRSVQAALKL
jgi:hypothetical protein